MIDLYLWFQATQMNSIDASDQSFLDTLYEAIQDNLSNEQFGVAELAQEVGVSRTQLHRRLHALTGQSSSQLIREYRLKKARELLENETATAAEVAYKVGFGSPSYFNTCFHDYFGFSPGEAKFKKSFHKKRKSTIPRKVTTHGIVCWHAVWLNVESGLCSYSMKPGTSTGT